MDPAFAPAKRRLGDLRREWEKLRSGRQLLSIIRQSDADEETKSWVVNATLSAGVSGLYTGMPDLRFHPGGPDNPQRLGCHC